MKNGKLRNKIVGGMSIKKAKAKAKIPKTTQATNMIEFIKKQDINEDLKFLKILDNKRMGHKWHGGCFVRVGYLNENDDINKIKKAASECGFRSTLYVYRTKQGFIDSEHEHEITIGIKDENAEINIVDGNIRIKNIKCKTITVNNANFRAGQGSIFIDNGDTGIKIKKSRYNFEDEYTDICNYLCLKYQYNIIKAFPDIIAKSFDIVRVKALNVNGILVTGYEHETPINKKSISKINSYLKAPRYAIIQEKVDTVMVTKGYKRKIDSIIIKGLSDIFKCYNRDPKPHSFGYDKNGKIMLFDVDQFITKLNIIECK